MNGDFNVIHTPFDKVLLILTGWFFSVLFLLWSLVNIVKTNNFLIWILTIPLGLIISILLINQYKFNFQPQEKKTNFAQILFIFLLILVTFYYLEPVIRYPMSTIGIPNKDLHDGLSVFIADNGFAPQDTAKFAKNFYILSSQNGLYLGYPNLLHSLSALLIKIGAGIFQATWLSVTIGLFFTSLAIFLLSRLIYHDDTFSAILGGLFAVSSFRIPLTAVASIPMLFSLLLILPSLLIFLICLKERSEQKFIFILPSIALSLIAVSYGGTIFLFLGILFILFLLLLASKQRVKASNLARLVVFSVPLLIICSFFLKKIYWENTFPTIKDFDPNELSQRLLPFDQTLYMIVLVISLIAYSFETIKKKITDSSEEIYRFFFFVLVVLFLIPIGLYFIFDLTKTTAGDIFGHLNFQKMMRLALVQPYIFIFFLGYAIYLLKKPWRYILITVILLFSLIIRPNLSFYRVVSAEVGDSFYNQNDQAKPYTLLSHWRLIVNNQIWSRDIFAGLDWLKNRAVKERVLLWDERGWTEETVANWGSIFIRKKIWRPNQLGIKNLQLNYSNLDLIKNRRLIIFMINPSKSNFFQVETVPGAVTLFSQGRIFLFQLP